MYDIETRAQYLNCIKHCLPRQLSKILLNNQNYKTSDVCWNVNEKSPKKSKKTRIQRNCHELPLHRCMSGDEGTWMEKNQDHLFKPGIYLFIVQICTTSPEEKTSAILTLKLKKTSGFLFSSFFFNYCFLIQNKTVTNLSTKIVPLLLKEVSPC